MATARKRRRKKHPVENVLGWVIPFTLVALAIYQELNDHKIDKYLIGALLIFGLGSLGLRLDEIVGEKIAERVSNQIDPLDGNGA